jgi:hypothetical protein
MYVIKHYLCLLWTKVNFILPNNFNVTSSYNTFSRPSSGETYKDRILDWTLTPFTILNYNLQWRSRQFSITLYILLSLFQNYSLQSTITEHLVPLESCPTPVLWYRLPTALPHNSFSIFWNCLSLSRSVLYGALPVTDSCCLISFTNFRISGL